MLFSSNSNSSCRDFLNGVVTVNSQKALSDGGDIFIAYLMKFYEKYGDIDEVTDNLVNGIYDPEVKDVILNEYGVVLISEAISMDYLDKVDKLMDLGVNISMASDYYPEPILTAALDLNQSALKLFKLKSAIAIHPKIDSAIEYVKCMKGG